MGAVRSLPTPAPTTKYPLAALRITDTRGPTPRTIDGITLARALRMAMLYPDVFREMFSGAEAELPLDVEGLADVVGAVTVPNSEFEPYNPESAGFFLARCLRSHAARMVCADAEKSRDVHDTTYLHVWLDTPKTTPAPSTPDRRKGKA